MTRYFLAGSMLLLAGCTPDGDDRPQADVRDFVLLADGSPLFVLEDGSFIEAAQDGSDWRLVAQKGQLREHFPLWFRQLTVGADGVVWFLWQEDAQVDGIEETILGFARPGIARLNLEEAEFEFLPLGYTGAFYPGPLVPVPGQDPLIAPGHGDQLLFFRPGELLITAPVSPWKFPVPSDGELASIEGGTSCGEQVIVASRDFKLIEENGTSTYSTRSLRILSYADLETDWTIEFEFTCTLHPDLSLSCGPSGEVWGNVCDRQILYRHQPGEEWRVVADIDEKQTELDVPPFRITSIAASDEGVYVAGATSSLGPTVVVLLVRSDGSVDELPVIRRDEYSAVRLRVAEDGSLWCAAGKLFRFDEGVWNQVWP